MKTRRRWCSGEVSARKVLTGYGRSCAAHSVLIKDVVSRWIGESSRRKRGINLESGERIVGLDILSWFTEYSLQPNNSMQPGTTEEEEVEQQQQRMWQSWQE